MKLLLCFTTYFYMAAALPGFSGKKADALIASHLEKTTRRNARITIQVDHRRGKKPPISLAYTWLRHVRPSFTAHLIRMESPPSQKGKLVLVHEGSDGSAEYTAYRPKSTMKKKVRISGSRHYKYKSLRISIQELIGGELGKYTHHYIGQQKLRGVECHLIENRIKLNFKRKTDYPRSILALRASNHLMVRWELYDKSNRLEKEIVALETLEMEGVEMVTQAQVTNLKRGSKLLLKVNTVEYNPKFDPKLFEKKYLSRN